MSKNFAGMLLLIVFSTFAALAHPDAKYEAMKAVINSPALKRAVEQASSKGYELKSVNQSSTYRCPGCFGFEINFHSDENGQAMQMKLRTKLDMATDTMDVEEDE